MSGGSVGRIFAVWGTIALAALLYGLIAYLAPSLPSSWLVAISGTVLGLFAVRRGLRGRRVAVPTAVWTLLLFCVARAPAVAAEQEARIDAALVELFDASEYQRELAEAGTPKTAADFETWQEERSAALRRGLRESSSLPAAWYGSLGFLDLVFLLMGSLLVYRFVARAPGPRTHAPPDDGAAGGSPCRPSP